MSYKIALSCYNALLIAEKLLTRIYNGDTQEYYRRCTVLLNDIQDEIHDVQKGKRRTLPGPSITSSRAIEFIAMLNNLLTNEEQTNAQIP